MYEEMFAERLAKLRTIKGVSAREMSLAIGQNESYINRIESKAVYPSMQVFFYICEYLQISPAEFFCEDNPNPKELNDILKDLKSLNYEKRMHIHEVIKDLIK
ncbi:MAG: helix-turn-helix transcriptional regulator [Clostridiales bacterium]|nr:helix-turn-helix transcriptional regulator [Clostridiales bacterium]